MFNIFKKKKVVIDTPVVEEKNKEKSLFWGRRLQKPTTNQIIDNAFDKSIKSRPSIQDTGMDSVCFNNAYSMGNSYGVNPIAFEWFASDSFIGFGAMAIIAQNSLISKACNLPAKDAIRKGWKVSTVEDTKIDSQIFDEIRNLDKHKYKIKDKLINQSQFTKVYGIRVALFVVESTDPMYYEKPFNIDGVKAGSYKGISQIDPQWCTPINTSDNVSNPASLNYYEPTYWQINGKKYHKSHLVITRGDEVADILKPTYQYAGISLVQKIYNRLYGAEKTANEIPMLVQSKRLNVYKMEGMEDKVADYNDFNDKMQTWVELRDNYGMRFAGENDSIEQLETSLSDLDVNVMTQYQLVCSIANIPSYKLLNSPMKGFSSGDTEQSSYHEELENIQDLILEPVLDRHYQLLIKSEIKPKFNIDFNAYIQWNELDAITEKERAEIDEIKSRTDINYTNAGILGQNGINKKLTDDENSPYFGMIEDDDYEDDLEDFDVEAVDSDYVLDKCIEDMTGNAVDADYQGKKVTLNKPFRTPNDSKKFAVYVKNKDDNVIIVRFGDSDMEIRRDNEKARASFRARHDCENKTDKTKAGYWSCKLWSSKTVSEILS